MKHHAVQILMATYNGARHIENQLLSIIAQTHKNWKLLIHDDGSTDNTIEIIRKYQAFDNRILLVEDNIQHLGAASNFLHLLKQSSASYVMFCDQDDIWMEDKIALMVNAMAETEGPAAVYCNAYAYRKSAIISNKVTFFHPKNIPTLLFLNSGIQGCSLMFNRHLLKFLDPLPRYVYMHDHLITLAAVTFGRLHYLNSSLMFYRQHEHNVTGNYEANLFKKAINLFNLDKAVIDAAHYKAVIAFYDQYKDKISLQNRIYFTAYQMYTQSSRAKRLFIILRYGFKLGKSRNLLLLKTLMRKALKND